MFLVSNYPQVPIATSSVAADRLAVQAQKPVTFAPAKKLAKTAAEQAIDPKKQPAYKQPKSKQWLCANRSDELDDALSDNQPPTLTWQLGQTFTIMHWMSYARPVIARKDVKIAESLQPVQYSQLPSQPVQRCVNKKTAEQVVSGRYLASSLSKATAKFTQCV
ncbi:hypothetical protein [Paraferrimonas sp. SM1919]|uniref:hypothetical protein n=1 Tax=Paraferrimonas sp. SM1919 TaxID=2662263 RepID=UPI0013D742F8|nr:hypothetical protein [Paraferrimonas sp. SM1919]